MDKRVFCIYPICNRDDIGIFFNEETQQYITYTGKGEIPEKTIRNIGLIFTPIILGAHYSFKHMWMDLLDSNIFRLVIVLFLFLYICSAYIISIKIYNNIYKKTVLLF